MSDEKLSRPDSKAGRLQRACLALSYEHLSDGALPTSGRFLFYELADRGIFPKAYHRADGTRHPPTPAQDISDALTHLREVGLIPWEDIVDETRTLDVWAYAELVVEFLLEEISLARTDVWDGEEPLLILCESRSLAGALRGIAAEYLCPIASTNGQAAGFLHTSIAPHVRDGRRVFCLGDHDLSGGHIEENTRRVLVRYGDLQWEKIAITGLQVREHGYEVDAVEKKDNRYKPPRVFWAVEAFTPNSSSKTSQCSSRVRSGLLRRWLGSHSLGIPPLMAGGPGMGLGSTSPVSLRLFSQRLIEG